MKRPQLLTAVLLSLLAHPAHADNPIIKDRFTADPAALVYDGRVYLYTGRDDAEPGAKKFLMSQWCCFSSDDMVAWKDEGTPLTIKAFDWASHDAWASQVIERDGKFYWYAPMWPKAGGGFAIGVAVSDSPTGPFKDAIGKPLITNDMTRQVDITWDDIDPSVFIDDDGQAYLFWGNRRCKMVRLKPNMIELDGEITAVDLPKFEEAPWIHKYKDRYYLSYASELPEKIAYATADRITGPYEFQGIINDVIPGAHTNHQSIIEFKDCWFFFYHTASLPGGEDKRRSVCVEEMFYEPDGKIRPITQDSNGVTEPVK